MGRRKAGQRGKVYFQKLREGGREAGQKREQNTEGRKNRRDRKAGERTGRAEGSLGC